MTVRINTLLFFVAFILMVLTMTGCDSGSKAMAATPAPEYFVWLDWDPAPPLDEVDYYTLYL